MIGSGKTMGCPRVCISQSKACINDFKAIRLALKNDVFDPKVCGNECLFVPACDWLVSGGQKHGLTILRNPISSGEPLGTPTGLYRPIKNKDYEIVSCIIQHHNTIVCTN